ncbi:hypothetical protein ACLMJK_004666 [Lecanora helva]
MPEKRAIVYDWETRKVQVHKEKDLQADNYHILELPPRLQYVIIFVDMETYTRPSLESRTPEGKLNIELVRLKLEKMDYRHRVLRSLGLISNLYFRKFS